MIERALTEAATVLRGAGEPFLIATVVAVTGSAYRRPGARMLLTRERWVAGSVSGGCLEGDVMTRGWWRTEHAPAVVMYDASVDDADGEDELRRGLGLGCNGIVEILLERAGSLEVDPLAFIASCQRAQDRGALVTVFASTLPDVALGARLAVSRRGVVGTIASPALRDAMLIDAHAAVITEASGVRTYRVDGAVVRALVEAVLPSPRLFVLGAGHDVVPVVTLARAIGWEVIVCAPYIRASIRTQLAGADEIVVATPAEIAARIDASDRGAAVVMHHNYERDRTGLGAMLASRARYIGVLGPRHRTARMLADLGVRAEDARLHAPVGLDVGAETPHEIALAIVAEVQAVLARSATTSLRQRASAIHEPQLGERVVLG